MLTFSDTEERAVEKVIAALADMIPLEAIQPPHSPALIFPGLEIRLVLVNKYVGLISLQYYQTIIAYIIDTMPIATVSNIAQ